MTRQDEAGATDRMRRALLAFESAQMLLVAARRRVQGQPTEKIEAFWLASGGRTERHVHATATELIAAFQAFSAAGLVADADDQRLVAQAQRYPVAVVA